MKTGATSAPDATTLSNLSFFKGLHLGELQTLAAYSMKASFSAGQTVFRKGELANRFYLILSGRVALESPVDKRAPICIETVGPGDVLGWSWLFPPYRWHFNARALEPVNAIFFYGTWLREHCETDHELGYALVARMAEVMLDRLQATWRQLSQTSTLALYLQKEALRLAVESGSIPCSAKKQSQSGTAPGRTPPKTSQKHDCRL